VASRRGSGRDRIFNGYEHVVHDNVVTPGATQAPDMPGVENFIAAFGDEDERRCFSSLSRYGGESQRRGPITKAGPGRARCLLIQAAVSILRRRPPEAEALWTWARRIAARRGKHVAVVALARRLAGILYALLRDGRVFQPRRTVGVPGAVGRMKSRAASER
jgi:hypothetical protein